MLLSANASGGIKQVTNDLPQSSVSLYGVVAFDGTARKKTGPKMEPEFDRPGKAFILHGIK